MEPSDDFERELFASLPSPPEVREDDLRAPVFAPLGWFWVAQHLVDEDCGIAREQPLESREQMRALIATPDGRLHGWPWSRMRNRPWSDEPGFRDVIVIGDGAVDELMVEVTDHEQTLLVARAGEDMPAICHFPISYIDPDSPQPTLCLADELLSRREAFSVAQSWLRRGRIPEGYEYRRPYPQPGLC